MKKIILIVVLLFVACFSFAKMVGLTIFTKQVKVTNYVGAPMTSYETEDGYICFVTMNGNGISCLKK